MKRTGLIMISMLLWYSAIAQKEYHIEGKVTYVNDKHVYVAFETTENMFSGDTLMVRVKENFVPALIIKTVSSRSLLTELFLPDLIEIGFLVAFSKRIPEKQEEEDLLPSAGKEVNLQNPDLKPKIVKPKTFQETFSGKISVSANGSIDDQYNRIRTATSFHAKNIHGGRFSMDSYIIYRRRLGADQIQRGFSDDFKIYDLSLGYRIGNNTQLSVGRKINNRIANMGAIDGLQVEHQSNSFFFGAFGGTRPDYMDYSFNKSLMQYGGFIGHESELLNGFVQTSLAFVDQKNNFRTDRRFMYFQHTNSLIKNMNFFYSIEVDLFQNIDSVVTNKINLTSTYVSLRYRPVKPLSLSLSYDNRRNVIYYETYKTFLEQLLQQETRQGMRFSANYRALKTVYVNFASFYRYQASKQQPTRNFTTSVNFARLPGLEASVNFNINKMYTYYFDGVIYGARLNKSLFQGKTMLEASYRKVDYLFTINDGQELLQNIIGFSTSFYSNKRTSLMLSYEGTFEPDRKYNRYFITLTQNFRNK